MELLELLKNRNCADEVYLSDVYLWLGADLGYKKMIELQDKLTELANKIGGSDGTIG